MGNLIEKSGDLFTSGIRAIGHGINIRGRMGAGIAKAFSTLYPDMFEEYRALCESGDIRVGTTWLWEDPTSDDIVLNIASQDNPGPHARIEWLESGVVDAIRQLRDLDPETKVIGLPRIGCGIGGLDWHEVRFVLDQIAQEQDIDIQVWTP